MTCVRVVHIPDKYNRRLISQHFFLNQCIRIFYIRTKPKTRYAQTVRFLSESIQILIADLTKLMLTYLPTVCYIYPVIYESLEYRQLETAQYVLF